MSRLVVVSNRVGPLSDEGKAGGLAVGIGDALRERGGVWFGWSGETSEAGTFGPPRTQSVGDVQLVTLDMTPADVEEFYTGYTNQTLWPIFHYRTDLATFERRFAEAYRRVNCRMAERLLPMLQPDDLVWVHDYHFLPFGDCLRELGFAGRIGFFLHTPFPAPEIAATLPDAKRLIRGMLAYDVIGFQTEQHRANFCRTVESELNLPVDQDGVIAGSEREVRTSVFPIGIDAKRYAGFATSGEARRRESEVHALLRECPQIIGVDRLDYSKGLPERLKGFERLLQDFPENIGKVSLLQVAPVSRGDVDAYAALRREIEETAGHINGRFATLDWTPIRIMTRGFTRKGLAGIYRASRVCLLTPLRDGMNLVAKEYVAAQDAANPGVLVLSRFAGAACELSEALIVNPHDPAEVAAALQRALRMPLAERQERWEALNERVMAGNAARWSEAFLAALGGTPGEERASQPSFEEGRSRTRSGGGHRPTRALHAPA